MKRMRWYCLALPATLAACGGGVTVTGGESINGTSYDSVIPAVNSRQVFAETIVDNGHNTINLTLRHTVTAVADNGLSFTLLQDDPSNTSQTVNGTTYAVQTETITENASGQETGYSYTPSGGSLTTCSYSPHGAGPDYPLTLGQTWDSGYALLCSGASTLSYQQSGSISEIDSVTVPAGTFTALRLDSTLTWTDSAGTTRVETISTWRDTATSRLIKRVITTAYSGTLPTHGYPVSTTLVLQSQS